jgi:polyisoprenoid-binding protein YceI
MKYLKMLGLLAVAAAALMAFAGTASATTPTSPKGTAYTGVYKATAGLTQLHGSFTTVQCGHSFTEGKIEQHGANVTTKGTISQLTFTECNYSVTVKKLGSLEAHATKVENSNADGTVTSTGAEIAIHTSVGECVFTTSGTDIGTGTLTSTATTGGNAKLDIKSASIPRTGGSFFCGSSATWTGSYTVTTPSTLYIDA